MASSTTRAVFQACYILVILLSPCKVSGAAVSINGHTTDFVLELAPTQSLSLWCATEGNAADEELVWYREDGQLDLKEGNRVNRSQVCVSPVSSSDNEVTFTCLMKSNSSAKVTVVLDVLFPPILSGETNLTVEEGGDVELTCHVRANPQPEMAWRQANGTLVLKKDRFSQSWTSEVLRLSISKAEKSDGGTYTCEAYTGQETMTRDFHLVVEDKKPIFPMEAVIAAVVVGALTIAFGIFARRERIFKYFKKPVSTAL